MDNIYTCMKGKKCPLNGITCQEGFCFRCDVPPRIPTLSGKARDVFKEIKKPADEHGDLTLGILDSYFGRSYN